MSDLMQMAGGGGGGGGGGEVEGVMSRFGLAVRRY